MVSWGAGEGCKSHSSGLDLLCPRGPLTLGDVEGETVSRESSLSLSALGLQLSNLAQNSRRLGVVDAKEGDPRNARAVCGDFGFPCKHPEQPHGDPPGKTASQTGAHHQQSRGSSQRQHV